MTFFELTGTIIHTAEGANGKEIKRVRQVRTTEKATPPPQKRQAAALQKTRAQVRVAGTLKMAIGRAHSIIGHDVDGNRPKDDFYPTPPEAVLALLSGETFDGPIWEPACGDGAISMVLESRGHSVISTDLIDRGYGTGGVDFLFERELRAPNIITNPPFKLAQEFAEHALNIGTKKLALLLKINFLEGVSRVKWLEFSGLARVHVFKKRLTLLRPGRTKTGGGMITFAWFIWLQGHSDKPQIGWL